MENDLVFTKSIKGQAACNDNNLNDDEMAVIKLVDATHCVEKIIKATPYGIRPHAEEILLRLARTGLIKPLVERREVSCESYCQAYKGMQFLSENEVEQRMLFEQKCKEEHARAEEWMAKCLKLHKRVEEYGNIFQGQLNNAKLLSQQYQKQFEEEQAARLKLEVEYNEAQQHLKELDAELLDLRRNDEKLKAVQLIQEEHLASLKQEERELITAQLNTAKLLSQKYQRQFEDEQAARLKVEADFIEGQQCLQERKSLAPLKQQDGELAASEMAHIHPYYQLVRPLGFCKNMSDAELSDLLFIAEWHDAKAGDIIFNEGEQSAVFYIVVSGKLRAVKHGRPLGKLRVGDVFGEQVFLSGGEPVRFEGVIAKTDCRLMVIDPAKLGNNALTFQLHVMQAFVRREVEKLYKAEERISNSFYY